MKKSTWARYRAQVIFTVLFSAPIVYIVAPLPWTIVREIQTYAFTPVEARAVSYTTRVVDDKYLRHVLEYRYRVDGEELTGTRMYPTPGRLPAGETPDSVRSAYPPGARFTAYVNPLDPSDAVVRPGLRGATLHQAMVLSPIVLVVCGLILGAWRRVRGPRGDRLASTVWAVRGAGGSWALRVMVFTPPLLAALVLGIASLVAGWFVLDIRTTNAPLSDAIIAWIVVLALAAASFAWLYLRMRRGMYDWRYDAARGLLHPPRGAPPWRRSEIAGLELVQSTSKDSDGAVTHEVKVRLRSRAGEAREVTSAETTAGLDATMEELAAVVRFLEEKLGVRAEVVPAA